MQNYWGTPTKQFAGEPGTSEALRSARRCRQALHTKAPVLRYACPQHLCAWRCVLHNNYTFNHLVCKWSGLSSDYLNATSVLSRPLICWFASHGCTGSCQKLLTAKVNPDVRELNFEAGNPTALLLAARGGHSDCIEVLLDGGADLLLTDDFGVTAMHEAAGSPYSDDSTQAAVLSKLLQHPAAHALLHKGDANKRSPVALAASRGFTACIKLLLDAYDPSMRQAERCSMLQRLDIQKRPSC